MSRLVRMTPHLWTCAAPIAECAVADAGAHPWFLRRGYVQPSNRRDRRGVDSSARVVSITGRPVRSVLR